jgi:hypothetical protein
MRAASAWACVLAIMLSAAVALAVGGCAHSESGNWAQNQQSIKPDDQAREDVRMGLMATEAHEEDAVETAAGLR